MAGAFYRFVFLLAGIICLISCTERGNKETFDPEKNYSGEELAGMYCGSCHAYPEPSLLSRRLWEKNVLPLMGQKLGIIDFNLAMRNGGVLQNEKSISDSNWQKLRAFYLQNAVEGKKADERKYTFTSSFQVRVPESSIAPLTTVLQFNSQKKEFLLSSNRTLYNLRSNFTIKDSLVLPFPVTHLNQKMDKLEILCVGNIHPNDQQEGKLFSIKGEGEEVTEIADSLRRPVYFASLDLNKDGVDDKVVCEFGNNIGELSILISSGESMEKRILSTTPGARKVVGYDFDDNGYTDLLVQFCQGDERVSIFYNDNLDFREEVVARFPPVYGSSTFDTLDFNQDGKLDFYAVFGDNADYSIMLKEYHGVRIFENNGENQFNETSFTPVYGTTDARADDFDRDGDMDFAVIAHFADFRNAPQNSFVYLENEQGTFKPAIVKDLPAGKWLTMEMADPDDDGDQDLFLGSFMLAIPPAGSGAPTYYPPFIQLENLTVGKAQK